MSVNAPESGTIKEFLVSEEDTVTVGQDLVRLELGSAPEAKEEEAHEKPKEPAPTKEEKPAEEPKAKEKPKAEEPKPQPPRAEQPKAPSPSETQKPSKPATESKGQEAPSAGFGLGSREERRVRNRYRALSIFCISRCDPFVQD